MHPHSRTICVPVALRRAVLALLTLLTVALIAVSLHWWQAALAIGIIAVCAALHCLTGEDARRAAWRRDRGRFLSDRDYESLGYLRLVTAILSGLARAVRWLWGA